MELSTGELAAVLGVTERRVQQLEKAGVCKRLAHGAWDLAESVQGYLRHRLQSVAKRRSATAGNADERLKSAKADREILRLAMDERALIPLEEATAALDDILGIVRTAMFGLAARVTRDLTLRARIETEIDAAFGRATERCAKQARALRTGGDDLLSDAEDDT